MIYVTKTFLPPQEEYQNILTRVWETAWLTNRGVLVLELEEKLKNYLKVPNILAMANGTLPLQIAIKALNITGEIITTPFSYVATTSSISWEGCTPVFVDIDPKYLTIDETKIEAAITLKTEAILATHVFGNPCAVEAIEVIAKKHNLKVIYDAAHCFGVAYKGKSLLSYGDVSTCSFHATKLFHTGEGGAIVANDETLYDALFSHHNFGHKGNEAFQGIGINGKMSELQAAMGLAVFPYINDIFKERESIVQRYNAVLENLDIQILAIREGTHWNNSYYPIIFKDIAQLDRVQEALNSEEIYPRRYFYPSLNTLDYVGKQSCPISESVASRVLCLPLYVGLGTLDQDKIIDTILSNL
ncbi:DegT/DnrJ/EryC1/StrS family aminotransferase [Winogradskyella immobilis]|uniref:DegT/DnrJ/EryC1/StrS family aminotransferase n=1 Tax=Winogradskyella immobilis TaxID=2816852 RepID=A0ABS8ENY0_9FLAO|nr:DegT/DnrJ/EryC1/StrS family aminotransferase [Winogradskyella immobilis]MCC1484909.1 DegT/DnrJ/EryC1/StrS family aminotransferase [Winogradskyella immobilis]MCG0017001.1 DegT/DnrJ/EryC1/StrS family aminotransferase [Winogradskyella immobilis]